MNRAAIIAASCGLAFLAACQRDQAPHEEPTPSNMEKVTANKFLDWEPAYSPDMTKIIYASAREGDWDLYVRDVDGGNEQRLTTDPAEDRTPSWSPDG
ncbi:MAG: PD40 domain-containing protein, partial [Armatimonadetes bacterium]|nr:PD40 domain-containing protein [Armatimonadota bacterium]